LVDIYSLGKIYYELSANLNLSRDEEGWMDAMEAAEIFEFIPGFQQRWPAKVRLVPITQILHYVFPISR
jgi:hypothetical protein